MSVASQIQRIKNAITSAYTSITNKGGTLPATQNVENLATAIESIPSSSAIASYGGSPVRLIPTLLFADSDGNGVNGFAPMGEIDTFVCPPFNYFCSWGFDYIGFMFAYSSSFETFDLSNVNNDYPPAFNCIGSTFSLSLVEEILSSGKAMSPYLDELYNEVHEVSFLTCTTIFDDKSENDYTVINIGNTDIPNLTLGIHPYNETNVFVLNVSGTMTGDWCNGISYGQGDYYNYIALINHTGTLSFESASYTEPFSINGGTIKPIFQLSNNNTIADVQDWFSSYGTGEYCDLASCAFITTDNGTSIGKTAPADGFTLVLAYNFGYFLSGYYLGQSSYNVNNPDFLANVAPEFRFVCDQTGDIMYYYIDDNGVISYFDEQGQNAIECDDDIWAPRLYWNGTTYPIDTWTEANDYTLSFGNGAYTFTAWAKRRYNPSSNN